MLNMVHPACQGGVREVTKREFFEVGVLGEICAPLSFFFLLFFFIELVVSEWTNLKQHGDCFNSQRMRKSCSLDGLDKDLRIEWQTMTPKCVDC